MAESAGQNGPPGQPASTPPLEEQQPAQPCCPRILMSFSPRTLDPGSIADSDTEWPPHVAVHFQAVLGRKQAVPWAPSAAERNSKAHAER
jgi:hypothetical protein